MKFIIFNYILGLLAALTLCNSLELQSPSFLDDALHLDKETAKTLFRSKLISLLNSLSARRHCHFVAQLAAKLGIKLSRTQDLITKLQRSSSSSRLAPNSRRSCRYWESKVSNFRKLLRIKGVKKSPSRKAERLEIIKKDLPSLYNNLPLPFQCEMLFEVGRKSILRPFEASENSVNSVTKMNLYEVGNIIKKSEITLIEGITSVRVADRCVKVLAGKKYRTTDVIISVNLGSNQLQKWKRGFRAKMQWIMGRFAEHNGIKLGSLHNLTSKQNLPYSAYFTHFLNTSKVGQHVEIRFHMHLRKANSRALEARFVLTALDSLDKQTLMKILDVSDVKYWAVDHVIGTGSSPQSYNLKMLFPTYLRRYFNDALRRHERCLIKHFVTQYSNSSSEKVMQFLKRKKINVNFPCSIMNGVMSVVVSPKRNRENEVIVRKTGLPVGKTTPRTIEIRHFWRIGGKYNTRLATNGLEQMKKKYVHYRRATAVEIVMFVLLGSLSIVLIIFFVTCVLFIVRKQRLRKDLQRKPNDPAERNAQPQLTAEGTRDVTRPLAEAYVEDQNLPGASQGQSDVQCECALLPRDGVFLHDKRRTREKIINVTLEPLRFSTDEEENRCDEEDSPRFSPTARMCEPSSIYRGGRRLVPAVRYSKALARKRARSDSDRAALENVPEKGTFERQYSSNSSNITVNKDSKKVINTGVHSHQDDGFAGNSTRQLPGPSAVKPDRVKSQSATHEREEQKVYSSSNSPQIEDLIIESHSKRFTTI